MLAEYVAADDIMGERPENRQRLGNLSVMLSETNIQPGPAVRKYFRAVNFLDINNFIAIAPLHNTSSIKCPSCGAVIPFEASCQHDAPEHVLPSLTLVEDRFQALLEDPDVHICSLCEGVMASVDKSTGKSVFQGGTMG